MNLAFTQRQAKAISKDFQYLVGELLSKDGDPDEQRIEHVSISPYDDINKWIFLHTYTQVKSLGVAINEYKVPFYDVLLIGPLCAKGGIPHHCRLLQFLEDNRISFDKEYYLEKF